DFKVTFSDGTTMWVHKNIPNGAGEDVDFTLLASDYGKTGIKTVEGSSFDQPGVNDSGSTVSFMLTKVTVIDCPPSELQDQFKYKLVDDDTDTSSSTLTLDIAVPKLIVGENADDKSGSTVAHEVGCTT